MSTIIKLADQVTPPIISMTGNGILSSENINGGISRSGNMPLSTKVYLHIHGSDRVIATTTSDENGHWEFRYLSMSARYWVRIQDPNKTLNGAVLDWLTPTPID